MKKIVFQVLLSFCVLLLSAQNPVSISVNPGIAISKQFQGYSGEDYGGSDYKGEMYTGISLEFFHHKHISFIADNGFVVKTANNLAKTYDYIYLNPQFKYRWELGDIIPYLLTGPVLDILVTRDAITEGSSANPKQLIWGIMAGMAVEYRFFPFGFLAGFQYQYDFTNAYESSQYTWKYSTFVVFLGLKAYFGASPEKNRRGYNYEMF